MAHPAIALTLRKAGYFIFIMIPNGFGNISGQSKNCERHKEVSFEKERMQREGNTEQNCLTFLSLCFRNKCEIIQKLVGGYFVPAQIENGQHCEQDDITNRTN